MDQTVLDELTLRVRDVYVSFLKQLMKNEDALLLAGGALPADYASIKARLDYLEATLGIPRAEAAQYRALLGDEGTTTPAQLAALAQTISAAEKRNSFSLISMITTAKLPESLQLFYTMSWALVLLYFVLQHTLQAESSSQLYNKYVTRAFETLTSFVGVLLTLAGATGGSTAASLVAKFESATPAVLNAAYALGYGAGVGVSVYGTLGMPESKRAQALQIAAVSALPLAAYFGGPSAPSTIVDYATKFPVAIVGSAIEGRLDLNWGEVQLTVRHVKDWMSNLKYFPEMWTFFVQPTLARLGLPVDYSFLKVERLQNLSAVQTAISVSEASVAGTRLFTGISKVAVGVAESVRDTHVTVVYVAVVLYALYISALTSVTVGRRIAAQATSIATRLAQGKPKRD